MIFLAMPVGYLDARIDEKKTSPFRDVESINTQRFDIDAKGSAHADGKVEYVCNVGNGWTDSNDLFDDETTVVGQSTESGYQLSLAVNSDAQGLWNNGKIDFIYHQQTDTWTMKAFVFESGGCSEGKYVDWKLCNPEKVFDIAMAGILCVAADEGIELYAVVASLDAHKEHIVATSDHYKTEADCTPAPSETTADDREYPSDFMQF